MNLKTVFVLGVLLSTNSIAYAEKPKNLSLRIEFGGNEVTTSLNEAWNIRQDVGSYNYETGSTSNSVATDMYVTHFGIKPEMSFFDNKLALSSGLRFSHIASDLSMVYNNNNAKKFFYLRYNTNGLNTEFARVNAINQSNNYIGIPFDVRLIPFSVYKFDFYLKTGIELNFKVGSKTTIDFVNDEMNEFQDLILNGVGVKVNNIYSTWSSALGVSFGNKNKLRYNLEFLLPSFFLTTNNSSLVNSDVFTGFQLSIQFPINNTSK